jgi:polysaccharide pyruvyl transferase WcaK-like protein
LGTDTAWTFEPLGAEYATRTLREAGWDGKQEVWVFCPINPFFWPVKPSLAKFVARTATGAYNGSHYRSIYFHNSGPQVERAYARYLTAFSNAVSAFRKQHDMFPVVVGMERLDSDACRRMASQLGGAPVFSSEQYDMFQLVSILRRASFMVSSRYHAIVTSMPGLVASAGVTMDERIRNLMRERGHSHLALEVDDPELEPKLIEVMNQLVQQADAVRDSIGRTVVRNLKAMARMGVYLEEHVEQRYPDFPVRAGLRTWEEYLPPLTGNLQRLAEAHGG